MTRIIRLSACIAPLLLAQCAATNEDSSQAPSPAHPSTTPTAAEETPATGPVPQRVIDDCLAALRQQIPNRDMSVLSARRGETSFIVDVTVVGVPKPWRCYHDGTRCTGTEYQGEG